MKQDIMTQRSMAPMSSLTTGPLNISAATKFFAKGGQASAFDRSQFEMNMNQSVANMSTGGHNLTTGNRNQCSKHKRKLVNFCLDHGVPLCSDCFDDHQGHKIQMLEKYAQAEVNKVQHLVDHLENSIRHVREKLELRRNLAEKKEIAARQFFDLTFQEMRRIEEEFWKNFKVEEEHEKQLNEKLVS